MFGVFLIWLIAVFITNWFNANDTDRSLGNKFTCRYCFFACPHCWSGFTYCDLSPLYQAAHPASALVLLCSWLYNAVAFFFLTTFSCSCPYRNACFVQEVFCWWGRSQLWDCSLETPLLLLVVIRLLFSRIEWDWNKFLQFFTSNCFQISYMSSFLPPQNGRAL